MESITNGLSQGDFTLLRVLHDGGMTDIITLIGSLGGGTINNVTLPLSINNGVLNIDLSSYSTTTQTNTIITTALTNYVTNTALANSLSAYTDTTSLTNLLSAKQNTISAGTGISIVSNVVSSTHIPMVLQLDGTTQTGATTLNFIANNAVLTAGVLNISRMAWQDAVTLRYSNAASDKNLSQGSAGELLWNGAELQLKQNSFQQINTVAPLSASGSNILTLETLWKPSTVTVGTGITSTANDTLGTLILGLDGTESRTTLKLIDSGSNVRNLQASLTGALVWNGSTLVDLTYLSSNFSTTSSINTSLALKADDAAVATAFAAHSIEIGQRQYTLTPSTGIFMNGATISSYDLRWNTNSTPTGTIECLRFENLTVAETLNISSGQIELKVSHPTAHTIAEVTGLQAHLDKTTSLIVGTSGLSSGDSTPATAAAHRIACYESHGASTGYGTYFYGIGLAVNASAAGLALWGGTGYQLPEQATGSGRLPDMLVTSSGLVGINHQNPSEVLQVTGNILASGSITGATKSFDIRHEGKEGYRLRHWCTESDIPGGGLLYKRQITAVKAGIADLIMPSWFAWLAKNIMVFAAGHRHFGLAWGEQDELDPCVIHITVSKGGVYNICVMADRNDPCATTVCPQLLEYLPEAPDNGGEPFPTP